MYFFIGFVVAIFIYILVYQSAKLPISPLRKNRFIKLVYYNLIVSIYKISLRFIRNGIYYKVPFQLQVPYIQLDGNTYYFFGYIGKFGYYSEKQIMQGKEFTLYLVSWKDLNVEYPDFLVEYPSGREEIWNTNIILIQKSMNKYIYRVSPYIFKEAGKVKIIISNQEKEFFNIEVKKNNSRDLFCKYKLFSYFVF